MPNFTEKDNENIARFAALYFAMADQLWTLKDRVSKEPKYRLSIMQKHGESLLKALQSQMSEEVRQIHDSQSEYIHEVLNEAMKAENKPAFLEIVKAYNQGKILIEQ